MKIGILTQPLGANYGGILQAYALQTMLLNHGYENRILNIRTSIIEPRITSKFINIFTRLIKRSIYRNKNIKHPMQQWYFTDKIKNILYKENLYFINRHIKMTKQIVPNIKVKPNLSKRVIDKLYRWVGQNTNKNNRNLSNINLKKSDYLYNEIPNQYDAFIVGSDQVWRPKYSPYLPHFFLDFVTDKEIKRIAYAASFGVSENEFTEELLNICKPLAQKFDALSVREDSGIRLCKELFDVDAIHVIDPTMFFDAEHYIKLSKERNDYFNDGNCFAYILDKNEEKQRIIDFISRKLELKPFNVMAKSKFMEVGPKHIDDCVMPPVEQWLDGFNKAKFVITDSFHGCVFSIIFKKPFIVIGNESRGMARFDSLLRMFKLENRLIHSENDLTEQLLNNEIDYDAVHEILARERVKAKMFLIKALS